jgi:hypothetical protein
MKGSVGVIRIRIQSKVAVVVKLTLEGIRGVQKAEKEKRCHLSKVRWLHMAQLCSNRAVGSRVGSNNARPRAGDAECSGSR